MYVQIAIGYIKLTLCHSPDNLHTSSFVFVVKSVPIAIAVLSKILLTHIPRASYQIRKMAGCACAGNAGNVFPLPRVGDSDMCHGTSFEVGGGENVPGIPCACETRNFTYLVRGPWFTPEDEIMGIFDCEYQSCGDKWASRCLNPPVDR